ncbi:hypothetical protein TorRG33x02_169020 [Trema orientale]|uniref:Uncharacterized protein n=1 Tax=Trema orientale TaxID=63057 RepID=A0A2P5ENZ8_TREOI|nr:hypothetical protein TorRG33x02_169020 [Trema orientale]
MERDKLQSFQISKSSNLIAGPKILVNNNNVIYDAELDILVSIVESDSLEKKKGIGSLSKETGADVSPLILPAVSRVGPVLQDQDEPTTSTKLRKPNLKTLAHKKRSSSNSSRENLAAKRKIEAGGSLSEMEKKQRQVLVENMNVLSAQAVS